jgi:hypothetical protein
MVLCETIKSSDKHSVREAGSTVKLNHRELSGLLMNVYKDGDRIANSILSAKESQRFTRVIYWGQLANP